MILTCPACSTRYRTDPDNFRPEGRRVRCSACGDVWFQTPPPEPGDIFEAESPIRLISAPSDSDRDGSLAARMARAGVRPTAPSWRERPGTAFAAAPAASSGSFRPGLDRFAVRRVKLPRWRGAIGWLALAAIILIPFGGALVFRTDVVNAWPKAARIYSALGIPVTDSGLLIHADASKVMRDGRRIIEVRGEIENQGDLSRAVPALQLTLYDENKRELYGWVVPVNRAPLDPKSRRAFRTTFPAPGKNVNVQIRFTEDE